MFLPINILDYNTFIPSLYEVNGLKEIFEVASDLKAGLYYVGGDNIFKIIDNGIIVHQAKLEIGFAAYPFMFDSTLLTKECGLEMKNYLRMNPDSNCYILNNKYIITELNKDVKDVILNGEFLIDASNGSIITYYPLLEFFQTQNMSNIINRTIFNIMNFDNKIDNVFAINNFDENPIFKEMQTNSVSAGTFKYIFNNPIDNKNYMIIIYKGIIPYKQKDKINLYILPETNSNIFTVKIELIRKKKIIDNIIMNFINIV